MLLTIQSHDYCCHSACDTDCQLSLQIKNGLGCGGQWGGMGWGEVEKARCGGVWLWCGWVVRCGLLCGVFVTSRVADGVG